jgi:hypothetical protein
MVTSREEISLASRCSTKRSSASFAKTKTLKVIQAQTGKVLTAPNTSYGNRR